ncbi:MAG: heme ABC exporter ATP-binding protein CcmA [Acidobacteriaceae bacterium]
MSAEIQNHLAATAAEQGAVAQLQDVSKLYGAFAALRYVTTSFTAGRCYVILGENGAGKSTLLRTLAGLIRPTLGTVRVFGSDPQEQRHRIGYMSHAPMLYDELTALENLRYYAALYASAVAKDGCRCAVHPESALRAVGLDPALARPVSAYSQGMRQRASLARVLLSEPELLLLDEPFSNMDAASAQQMTTLLREMQTHSATGQPRTILLTTHQPELARPIANCYLTMHAGQVVSVKESTEFGQ